MQQKLLPMSENYQRLIPRLKPDAVLTLYLWGHEPSIQPKHQNTDAVAIANTVSSRPGISVTPGKLCFQLHFMTSSM